MAEYNLFLNAEVNEANKKLDGIDKKLDSIDKKAGGLDIKFPNLDQVVKGFKAAGDAIKFVWDQSDGLLGSIHPLWGALGDLKGIIETVSDRLKVTGNEMVKLKKLMPTTIVGTAFEAATGAINNTAQATARLGYVFFGLQQSVNLVAGTFGAFFDNTIRRQAELEQTILQTRTTLASTTRVLADGMELRDPLEAIKALEGPIEETITNIRRRSLEIAGTTSEAIIQTFSVVSAQIGQIGGDLKDAEDLAISFAAALGTIGLSNPMYATQEIRSILTGNIDQNSVLARSLGITNEDIQKAKTSSEGLIKWLEKRLAAFGAGQKIAATQLSGVLSNVLEVWQEFTRELGKPLLQPLLDAANAVFRRLGSVFKELLTFASSIGYAFSRVIGLVQQAIGSSEFNLINDRDIAEGFEQLAELVGNFINDLTDQLQSYIVPMVIRILNRVKRILETLIPTVTKLVGAFAQFQIIKLEVFVDTLEYTLQIIEGFLPAINAILNLYSELMSNQLVRYLTQLGLYIKIFEDNGVNGLARFVFSVYAGRKAIGDLINFVKGAGSLIAKTFQTVGAWFQKTIRGIEISFRALTIKIIQMVADVGRIILAGINVAATKIKVALIEIATQAQAAGTAMGAAVSQGALAMAGAMDVVAKSSVTAVGQMDKLSKNAPKIADALSTPWQGFKKTVDKASVAIGTGLNAAFIKLRKQIIATSLEMAKFSIKLLLITVAIGAVVQAWSRYSQGVANNKAIQKGIEANRALAGSLKNVNEESSKFEQEEKRRMLEQRQKAIDVLNDRYAETADKIKKAREQVQILRKLVNAPFGNTQGGYANALEGAERKLRELNAQSAKDRAQLEEFYMNQQIEENRKEDKRTIQILAKERSGLEERIQKERIKLERELADTYFRIRQEIERKAFAEREAQMRVEMARIAKAQDLAKDGMTGVARTVADIIDDYQNEMTRIENERLKREFDLKQKIAELGKSAADYEFKLKEIQAKLAKTVGNFNTKVADYQTKQAERRNEAELRTAIQASKIRSQGFAKHGDEADRFKNAASGAGLSATNLLSFLYAGGAEKYGIDPNITPDELIRILRDNIADFDAVFKAGNLGFNAWLDKFVKEIGKNPGVGAFARNSAQNDLGTSFRNSTEIPAPPKMEKLTVEIQDLVNMRRAADKQLVDSIARLNKTMEETAKAIAGLKLDEFGRRSMLTDLPTQQSLAQQQGQARLRLMGMQAAGAAGGRIDPLIFQQTMLNLNKAIAQAGINNSKLNDEEKARATAALLRNYNQLSNELPGTIAAMKELKSLQLLGDLEEDIIRLRQEGFNSLIEVTNQALEAFASFGEESERRVAQVRIENEVAAKRLEFLRNEGELTEQAQDALKRFREELERTADAQDELRQKLEPLYEKLALAKDAAATLTEAYKDAAKSLLAGGDIKEISRNFAQALAGKTIDSFVEWVFKDMQKQLEEIFGDVLGLGDVEEQIKGLLEQYITDAELDAQKTLTALEGLATKMEVEVAKIVAAIEKTGAFAPRDGTPPPEQQFNPNNPIPVEVEKWNDPNIQSNDPSYPIGQQVGMGGPSLPTQQLGEAANNIQLFKGATEDVARNAGLAADATKGAAEANAKQATTAETVQGALAGATQMLMGIGMVAGGISQIKEGGTSNTLLGIGQVLMGVGSFGLGVGRMFMAQGAYVNSATPAMIGEGGTPEYVIPENKMASSMTRWASGMRGKGVVEGAAITGGSQNRSANQPTALGDVSKKFNPGNNYSSVNNYEAGSSASDNFSINITGEQLVFNEKNYVSQDEIPSIISQASKQGEARTLRKIRMSQSTRSRAGI